jgi:hypothetical protein
MKLLGDQLIALITQKTLPTEALPDIGGSGMLQYIDVGMSVTPGSNPAVPQVLVRYPNGSFDSVPLSTLTTPTNGGGETPTAITAVTGGPYVINRPNSSVQLNASGGTNYLWSFGARRGTLFFDQTGDTSTLPNPVLAGAENPGEFDLILTVTSNGVSDTKSTIATVVGEGGTNPTPVTVNTGGPYVIGLPDSSKQLNASGGDTYLWSFGTRRGSLFFDQTGATSPLPNPVIAGADGSGPGVYDLNLSITKNGATYTGSTTLTVNPA